MLKQFIGLGLGGLTVVPGGRYRHVAGNRHTLHPVNALEDSVRDIGSVGPLAFGHGNGHRRVLACCRRA